MKATLLLALLLPLAGARAAAEPEQTEAVATLIERCLGTGGAADLTAAVQRQVGKFVAAPRYTRSS